MAVSAMTSSEKTQVLWALDRLAQEIMPTRSPGDWATSSEANAVRAAIATLRAAVAAA